MVCQSRFAAFLTIAIGFGLLFFASCAEPQYVPSSGLPYMVHTGGSWDEVKSLSDEIGRVFELYEELFHTPEQTLPQLLVIVRIGTGENLGESEEWPALYQTDPTRIVFFEPPDDALLLHEIAHHFLPARLGPSIPPCINEGVATWLGWSAVGERGLILGEIAVEHSRVARRAAREGQLIALRDFFAIDGDEFYSGRRKRLHYSQSWAFVHFFFQEYLSGDLPFHRKLDRLAGLTPTQLDDLDPAFSAYCRDFPILETLLDGLRSHDDVRCQSAAFRLGLFQSAEPVDRLLHIALDPSRAPRVRQVALLSVGIIFLGPEGNAARERFGAALRVLVHDSSELIRTTAKELSDAVEQGDPSLIQTRYGAVGCNTDFYPAGKFKVSGG